MNKILKLLIITLILIGLPACVENANNKEKHENIVKNSIDDKIQKLSLKFSDADFSEKIEKKNEILNELNIFLDENPNNLSGLALRSQIYLNLYNLNSALDDVNQLNKLNPNGTQLVFGCMLNEKLQRLTTEKLHQCYENAASFFQNKKVDNINYQVAKYLSGDIEAKKNLEKIATASDNEIDQVIIENVLEKPRMEFINSLLKQN